VHQYEFHRITVAYKSGNIDPALYEQAICERAAEGWELVQIFVENPAAIAGEYVLIFKRPADH
jgi:hypothetical protein